MSKFEKERQRKMSTKFNDFLKEQLQDPEFQKEYEALQPEHAIMQAIIDARKLSGLTQKELSASACGKLFLYVKNCRLGLLYPGRQFSVSVITCTADHSFCRL